MSRRWEPEAHAQTLSPTESKRQANPRQTIEPESTQSQGPPGVINLTAPSGSRFRCALPACFWSGLSWRPCRLVGEGALFHGPAFSHASENPPPPELGAVG